MCSSDLKCSGGLVAQLQHPAIGIFIRLDLVRIGRGKPDEVTRDAGHQRALRRHRPAVQMGLEKVGVLFEISGRGQVVARLAESGGADPRGDVRAPRGARTRGAERRGGRWGGLGGIVWTKGRG